ncbi:MAG: hypothetical protein NVSMB1_21810 [Polyangiales bacterium]
MLGLASDHLLSAAHDVSEGGLSVALVEMAVGGQRNVGMTVTIPTPAHNNPIMAKVHALFGEGPTRVVVAVRPEQAEELAARSTALEVPCVLLGRTVGDPILRIDFGEKSNAPRLELSLPKLRDARDRCLESIVGA